MHHLIVDEPGHSTRSPVDDVVMEVSGGVKPEIYPPWRSSISKRHLCSKVARVEVDVDEHLLGVGASQLDVYFLPRRAPVKEESGDEA